MCECKLLRLGVFVVCNVILVTSFNIEKSNYALYESQPTSMFGFTVAMHKDGANRPWVLVGAPEAQARYHDREILRGGAVYKCNPLSDNHCEEIRMNPSQNKRMERLGSIFNIDEQSYQWFGATLSTSRTPNGPIVACAPRYIWFTKDRNRKDPVGTCFVSDGGLDSYLEYSPCRTMNWGYHRQGSCQAGFSAAINSQGDRLYVGAPGSYYWQGQMYSIDAHANFTYTPSTFGNVGYGAKGTVYQQPLENRPAVISTREGSPSDDDSYIGYSLVAGRFRVYDPNEGIAVGMPRGNKLRGKVLLFTWNLQNYKNLTISDQIGSYFGYSITAADVNGDHNLDIIVGAPMYTKPNNEKKYDLGRVYIFYQTDNETTSFDSPDTQFIDGKNSRARFGHSVSTLGDLNQDGYDDFAVGAPYDGPNGRGAVYIYYGSKKGVRDSYGQVIYAEDIQSRVPITTFGFSVTGGIDLDDNDYPDMAVGAYLSDAAVFFRSRPTVVVDAYVNFLRNQIDITKRNCNLDNRRAKTHICTTIKFCIKYTGKGIPERMSMNLEYVLDSKKGNRSRMFFKENSSSKFKKMILLYNHAQHECEEKEVYLSGEVRDKLTPLEAEVNYSLMDHAELQRNPRSQLRPVLDLSSPPSRHDTIFIQKDCGDDDVCIPDLHLNVTSDAKMHYLGSDADIGFDIVVSNLGEDAFEARFEMKYPQGIEFKKHEISAEMSGILCDSPVNNTISCDIGNPLPKRNVAKFRLLFQPPTAPTAGLIAPRYDFDAYVNSTNPEDKNTRTDNHLRVSLDIWVEASLELRGESSPPKVFIHNDSIPTKDYIAVESDIGTQVTHVYYLRNGGPSVIDEAEVYILWPYQTLGGEDLLYLPEAPHSKGNVKCEMPRTYDAYQEKLQYNYKGYRLEGSHDDIWDRLNIDTSRVEIQSTTAQTHNAEVGKGISSGVGVVNINSNATRYENTYTKQSVTINNKTGVTSRGKMYVDEYGNTRTSFENNQLPSQSNQLGGSQSETRQYYNEYHQGKSASGHRPAGQFDGRGNTHYREEAYEVGGGPREGGVQVQNGQRQFSTDQSMRQSQQNHNQQGSGERRQQTYYEHGSAGAGQFGQYGHNQFSTQNETYNQGRLHNVDGGVNSYYEQRGPPAEGEVIFRRTYTMESSTAIPIDATQLQGRPLDVNHQPLDEVAAGQGYRVQLIGMDNTASEISIAGTNRGVYDHSGRPAVSRNDIYNQSYIQSGGGTYSHGEGYRESYGQQGGSRSSQWHTQSGGIEPGIYQNSIERDNVPTDRPSPIQRRRGKRAYDFLDVIRASEKCGSTTCSVIRCTVEKIKKDTEVLILLRSRLNLRAVENITETESVTLSSMMIAKITKLPYIGEPTEDNVRKHEITTEIPAKEKDIGSKMVPMWVYVVSAVAGVIMLLLLIWILSKCGFFKRNRPSSAPERQPLNRNGYHSGDEAL